MPIIASENHYLKKVWEMSSIDAEVKKEFARMAPAELEAEEAAHREGLERLHRDFEKHAAQTVKMPSPWRRWRFKRATKMALAAAEYFQLNVWVEADERCGKIKLTGDIIMSEALVWHDNKQKRKLMKLIQWADSVSIGIEKEYDVPLIDIQLLYPLISKFTKPER